MGTFVCATFDREFPGFSFDQIETDGKMLLRFMLNVPFFAPLNDLVSMSEADYQDLLEEFPDSPPPADYVFREQWFDPAQGLATVEWLLEQIAAGSADLRPLPGTGLDEAEWDDVWVTYAVADLKIWRGQLKTAIAHRAKFHLV